LAPSDELAELADAGAARSLSAVAAETEDELSKIIRAPIRAVFKSIAEIASDSSRRIGPARAFAFGELAATNWLSEIRLAPQTTDVPVGFAKKCG
jgi:hypothetical protein